MARLLDCGDMSALFLHGRQAENDGVNSTASGASKTCKKSGVVSPQSKDAGPVGALAGLSLSREVERVKNAGGRLLGFGIVQLFLSFSL